MSPPRHRGPHPEDARLFADPNIPALQNACRDLGWLLDRGYVNPSALKLVGDRYRLEDRQRLAVMRSACSRDQRRRRISHSCSLGELAGQRLLIDGYNILTTIETALSGGLLFVGRDGCIRDLASVHGTYRRVQETKPALELAGEFLARALVAECHWLLDSPVSNSGRMKQMIEETGRRCRWNWTVDVVQNPDGLLATAPDIVITADSAILDVCQRWFHLMLPLLASRRQDLRVIDLSQEWSL
jgi:hypothetical protein